MKKHEKNVKLLDEKWCTIWFDEEINGLNANWIGFLTLDQVKKGCHIMTEFIRENKIKHHYSNQLSLKVLSKEIQNYLADTWFREVENLGLEKIVVLVSLNPYAKASVDKVNNVYMMKGKLEIFTFGMEKECLNWLKVDKKKISENEELVNKISVFQMLKVDEEVKKLDPLNIDNELERIQRLNKDRNVEELIQLLYSVLPSPSKLIGLNFYESLATMRDLGILIGSIKRHGKEPIEAVPELELILEELSAKTNLPPRDTLLHYTVWNPDGDRMRRYTSLEAEIPLIQSVKDSFPALEEAIDQLIKLHHTSFDSPYFSELCNQACDRFKKVINSIVMAHRLVSPEVFAKELRFYFDPIIFDREELIGPGAVEMPMFVFDHLLWSSKIIEPEYLEFKTKYLPYNLSFMREIFDNYTGTDSLMDQAIKKMEFRPSEQVMKSANSLLKLCNMQKSFRKPHKKLADKAYKHQEETIGKSKGSGGYTTDILGYIIDLHESKTSALDYAMRLHTSTGV